MDIMKLEIWHRKHNQYVEVTCIDITNNMVEWWDGQYDRCVPRSKLYEEDHLDHFNFGRIRIEIDSENQDC